jgi:hypothetical protein
LDNVCETGDPSCADNCTKEWHHNWVHDCREKCMRGDDYTFQLHGHHLVIYNCGMVRNDTFWFIPFCLS